MCEDAMRLKLMWVMRGEGVCHECHSHFSILDWSHHCGLCGRIFCSHCTPNSIRIPRRQVCDYCFKRWEYQQQHHRSGDEGKDYAAEDNKANPVDLDRNKLLFLPPEPEYIQFSTDFGSREWHSLGLSTEEQRKSLKNVVGEFLFFSKVGELRALLTRLLQLTDLDISDQENWLEIITSLSLETATLLKLHINSKWGGMDPREYVKIKCLACGHPTDSAVVKGVVCNKNATLQQRISTIEKPRFLVLGGSLQYSQEMDHMKMADAHHPQCFVGAKILPWIDHLSSQKLGYCDTFRVEKFVEEHGSAGTGGKKLVKTLMFFEGCPKPLGYTILLKGAKGDELKKLKPVLQYGILAAYHLFLVTSFLVDEGASFPELVAKTDDPKSDCTVMNQPDATDVPSLEPKSNDRASSKEEFPDDHEGILVYLSTRCAWKGTVCERPHLCRIKYYGTFDKHLGQYLRDHLFDQSYLCRDCQSPSEAHVHRFTHQQGSLTVYIQKFSEPLLPGEREGKIWMWHRCPRCPWSNGFPPATKRILMSDASWGLSLGKFLELSFSNPPADSMVASCGHSLHRDCLRYYGCGRMVACFQYASSKLDLDYDNEESIRDEANGVVDKVKFFLAKVLSVFCGKKAWHLIK